MNDASNEVSGKPEPASRAKRPPLLRLLIGYEHARCRTNTDVILPMEGLDLLTSPEALSAFEPAVAQLAEQHAPTCPVCGTAMGFAVWGPHDEEVETRKPFGSRDGDAA